MKLQKTVISPFLLVVFAASAITGVLMFFHIKNGPIVVVHEWLGMAFALAGVLHLVLNFRQLTAYFKTRQSWVALGAALALVALFVAAGWHGEGEGPRGHRPPAVDADDDE